MSENAASVPSVKRPVGRPRKHIETREEKFYRIASPRVDKAVYHVRLLANLASRTYKYSPKDVEGIRQRLQGELDAAIGALRGDAKKTGFSFR